MIDPQGQHDVLNGILQVLQRIETKLETQEARVKSVEDLIQRNRSVLIEAPGPASRMSDESSDVSTHGYSDDSAAPRPRDSTPTKNDPLQAQSHAKVDFELVSVYSKGGPKIKYGVWRPGYYNEDPTDLLDESYLSLLTQYLGNCSIMPDDGRLPLNFTWTINFGASGMPNLVDTLAETRRLEALRAFDSDLRAYPGNDFLAVDFDTSNNSRLYRVGQEAIGSELMVSSESNHDAPWSRLMYALSPLVNCTYLTRWQSLSRYDHRKQYETRIQYWPRRTDSLLQESRCKHWSMESYLLSSAA